LVTLARPLHVPTPDDVPLQLLLVIVGGGQAPLELLARAARLATPSTVAELCQAACPDDVLARVRHVESEFGCRARSPTEGGPRRVLRRRDVLYLLSYRPEGRAGLEPATPWIPRGIRGPMSCAPEKKRWTSTRFSKRRLRALTAELPLHRVERVGFEPTTTS